EGDQEVAEKGSQSHHPAFRVQASADNLRDVPSLPILECRIRAEVVYQRQNAQSTIPLAHGAWPYISHPIVGCRAGAGQSERWTNLIPIAHLRHAEILFRRVPIMPAASRIDT